MRKSKADLCNGFDVLEYSLPRNDSIRQPHAVHPHERRHPGKRSDFKKFEKASKDTIN